MVGTIKQDRRIKIWSCFSYNGVGEFYWIKDKLDADKYHYILQYKMRKSVRKLFGNGDYVFQHDNNSKHTSEKIKKYLENADVNVLNWPLIHLI